jgi:hypothetical protein
MDSHHLQYIIHYSTLEAAHATTLAVLGEHARAESMFRDLMERLRASGDHTRAFLMHEYRVKVTRLIGDRAAELAALQDMREAALASGNPSAILLADSVQNRRTRARSSPLPPARVATPDPHTLSMTSLNETVVTEFLRQEHEPQRRAQHALHMLGQYASSGEAYLYWVKQGTLELAASLDQREPPSALEALLYAIPANDQLNSQQVKLTAQAYTVVPILSDQDSCVGLAAFRDANGMSAEIPATLLADIGRALAAADTK